MNMVRKRPRKGKLLPPPRFSARRYVQIDPAKVHLFRFFLEAHDNLGIMTVADRWKAVLLVRFSPHQQRAMEEFLEAMHVELGVVLLPDISVLPTQ